MRSMTGYGTAEAETHRYRVAVTLRSVNHRYLDLVVRLKDEMRPSEPALRELLSRELHRGRVEVSVDLQPRAAVGQPPEVDRAAVEGLHAVFGELAREGLVEGGLTPGDLLRLPQVIRFGDARLPWSEEDGSLLETVADRALGQLVEARSTEGAKVREALAERLDGLDEVVGELVRLAPEVRDQAAADLSQRLEALVGDQALDPTRLAQEVAILADRSDVAEELDRLVAHLEHFREVMEEAGSIGKRLDFLAQEIFRELNTLGSKARHPEMSRRMLDAKVLAEQVREQIQNVE